MDISIYLKRKRELFDRLLETSEKLCCAIEGDDEEGILQFQKKRHEIIQAVNDLDGKSANIPAPTEPCDLDELGRLAQVLRKTASVNDRTEKVLLGRMQGVTADRRRNRVARAYARADAMRS